MKLNPWRKRRLKNIQHQWKGIVLFVLLVILIAEAAILIHTILSPPEITFYSDSKDVTVRCIIYKNGLTSNIYCCEDKTWKIQYQFNESDTKIDENWTISSNCYKMEPVRQ